MFHVDAVHSRLYSVNGDWLWDEEPITDSEAAHLKVHYESVVAALKKPWANRDLWYDELGRLNYAWARESV